MPTARMSYASRRLAQTAARMRELGDGGLKRQFRAEVRAAAKPLVADLRAAAEADLPKSGGLNKRVANQRITTQTLLSTRTAAVRLRMPFIDAFEANSGTIRHPVFADQTKTRKEWTWVSQQIPDATGWWTRTLEKAGPKVTAELITLMRTVNREIEAF